MYYNDYHYPDLLLIVVTRNIVCIEWNVGKRACNKMWHCSRIVHNDANTDDLVQDCSIPSALAIEIPQFRAKPSISRSSVLPMWMMF